MIQRMRRSPVSRRDVPRRNRAAGGAAAAHGVPGGVRPRATSAQGSTTPTVWDHRTRPVERQVVDTLS